MPLPKPPTLPNSIKPVQATRSLVWIIGFFAFLNVYSLQSVLPLVMSDFRATPVQAGLAVGATVLGIGLISPFMGMWSDAIGRKKVICSALFFLTIPTALLPFAGNFYILIFLRFLQGLAVPGIVVVIIAYMSEEFRAENVVRMTTAYVGGTVMGGFSGRFITGHASELLGWRGAFLFLAALNFVGAAMVLWKLPPSTKFIPNRHASAGLQTLLMHLRNQRLLAACAVGFCVLFSLVGAFTYINLHLAASPFQLSSSGLANVFLVYLVGVLVTPMAAPQIDRLGYQRTLQYGLAFSAAGLVLTLTSSLAAVVVGLAISSTGVFLCQSATIGAIAKTVTQGRSLATGMYYFCYYAGGAAGSWLAGLAYESYGWHGSVAIIVLFQLTGATIVTLVWRAPVSTSASAHRPPSGSH